ncbi:RNA-binding cell elongation regulator Jag/EloR [Ureibacillus terrenus]|uniref:RNA-binding protein KhpB n=1 Tax=Ureibacillus terrenus TaxID=118246 RepID=A0A540V307_9BACL|nr:RNA-binding cell elongation regulator Jag/EloR [Ureibacillus terrenus]TQE91108.1 protein jag [Ureibacillus terrenus]
MKQITQTGATKEEAIALALQKLGVTQDQVEIEVLQEARKGFLGFGARPAEVRVTVIEQQVDEIETSGEPSVIEEKSDEIPVKDEAVNEDAEEKTLSEDVEGEPDPVLIAEQYLKDVANAMGIHDLKVEAEKEGKTIHFKLESERAALLIGKHGSNLNALQQLTQLVVSKNIKSYVTVRLDVENYRERRQEALEKLAQKMADKAIRTGKKVALEPMPSYERKIIHNALANRLDVETYSEGEEPNRHLIIEPVK